ncbi:MAG TPA: hypothetical protein VLX30_12540 [Burkholderiales bacterium]|nr:hypothetical protein [Burkholderiales bacterium]
MTGDAEDLPAGSLRVMQVMGVASADVLSDANAYQRFIRSSFGFVSPAWSAQDESAVLRGELALARGADHTPSDGQLVAGRVYCCGGPDEFAARKYAFASRSIPIRHSDFVEVRFGRGGSGDMNVVTRVVSGCGWVPRDPKLWVRIPFCDWMPKKGWIEQKSILTSQNHAWIKPPAR